MEPIESIEEFYRRKFSKLPEDLNSNIGHFNLFRLEPIPDGQPRPVPYRRRDFYKVMLVEGGGTVHYADKEIEVGKQALSFSNPMIPYKWEHLERITGGSYCIFNKQFFHQFGDIERYSVFQPGGEHMFELNDAQRQWVNDIFQRMFESFDSEYVHKFDLLRTLVLELVHFAMQLRPIAHAQHQNSNANQRIASLFLELLERQFPIEENHPLILLRSPADFARQLNVHVNHLNRVLKETTGKTSSQVIAERVAQEGKVLLRHSPWTVKEIAWALGFKETAHFNNFFKKISQQTPGQFRKG